MNLTITAADVASHGPTAALARAVIADHVAHLGACRCTHAEIADLTGMTPRQAQYAVARLRDSGTVACYASPRPRAARGLAYVLTEDDL